MPGVPGLFLDEQAAAWKKITDAVHAKGGHIYAQLWHSGRANIPHLTGTPTVAPSAVSWDDPNETYPYPPPHTSTPVKLADHPPIELSVDHIQRTIADYCAAARRAMAAGFDGIEVHGGNGYLPEQFLSTNANHRTDAYGGTIEKRCAFPLELMEGLAATVGTPNLAIRLSPFGLFNQSRGTKRLETWSHLCRELRARLPELSYVSFIEPRYEQIFSVAEKQAFLDDWSLPEVGLNVFREIMAGTPFFSAGGFDDKNAWDAVDKETYDGLVFGRYFISNPDLVERLRKGLPLAEWDRSSFYGPAGPEGYTDYPRFGETKA